MQRLHAPVLFDNIIITEKAATGALVLNENNGNTAKINIVTGDSIELPTPTKENMTFNGWFADKKLTVPVTLTDGKYTTTIDATTNLYAGWIGYYDFSNPEDYDFTSNSSSDNSYTSYTGQNGSFNGSEFSVTEGGYLKFSAPEKDYAAGVWVINKNGVPITLEAGKTYTVSFKYKRVQPVDDSDEKVYNGSWLVVTQGAKRDGWSGKLCADSVIKAAPTDDTIYGYNDDNTKRSDTNNRDEIKINENKNQWKTYTKEFTAYDIGNIDNYLCFTVCMWLKNDFYIDDIVVVAKDTDYPSGAVMVEGSTPIVANAGADVEMPSVPDKVNYIAKGWYNGDTAFDGKAVAGKILSLSAKYDIDYDANARDDGGNLADLVYLKKKLNVEQAKGDYNGNTVIDLPDLDVIRKYLLK